MDIWIALSAVSVDGQGFIHLLLLRLCVRPSAEEGETHSDHASKNVLPHLLCIHCSFPCKTKPLSLCSLFASIPNHFFEDGFERGRPLDGAFESTFEFDPALIDAFDHMNSRRGIFHTLSAKDFLPSRSWNRLRLYRLAENVSQRRRDGCPRNSVFPRKPHAPLAAPRFKQEGAGACADIFRCDHGKAGLDRLEKVG